jgi:hypothetical protein
MSVNAEEIYAVLGSSFQTVRDSLLRWGLELTLAEDLRASDPNACSIGDCIGQSMRLSAIIALAEVLGEAGWALPKLSPRLEDDWIQATSRDELAIA